MAIGADSAPFGKANEACASLVSFLNVTERVSSPYDNFLICGGNSAEDHPSILEYGKLVRSQIGVLEKQTFTIKDQQIKLSFKLMPSDMKWLSKFSGELSNAAIYPNPFANVTKIICHGFMFIIEDLMGDGSDIEQPQNFFALSMAGMGLHLRNALLFAVRVSDIETEDLPKLEGDCSVYRMGPSSRPLYVQHIFSFQR